MQMKKRKVQELTRRLLKQGRRRNEKIADRESRMDECIDRYPLNRKKG